MDLFGGQTVIDVSVGGGGRATTVKVVLPDSPIHVAEMVVIPVLEEVASPPPEIVATLVTEELHVALPVTMEVDPSLQVTLATNGCTLPTKIVGLTGVIARDTGVGGGGGGGRTMTVRFVLPDTPLRVALIPELPAAMPLARPPPPMDATPVLVEDQVTPAVTFSVEPLL